jgi:uncharacterized membrane protein YgdD (TMEM256/DUF423 family)
MTRTFFVLGSGLACLGVVIGAFGAHALKTRISAEMLTIFEVGVRYQMYHALALFAVAWAVTYFHAGLASTAGWLFVAGMVIFSGSLYALALSAIRIWGAVTPLGGLLLIAGWCCLCLSALKS